MACMIPDRMPDGSSKGEKRVFDLLQNLPDQCLVYYEPIIANRFPDFIVIFPTVGVLVIEVKGWYIREIEDIDPNSDGKMVTVKGANEKHPAEQAREYMFKLMGCCKKHKTCTCLLHKTGTFKGQFKFPFAHMVVLSNIEECQLKESPLGDLRRVFPTDSTIYRDQLLTLSERKLSEEQWINFFAQYFNPKFPVEGDVLSEEDISALRVVIHPEIKIPSRPKKAKPRSPETSPTPPPTEDPIVEKLQLLDQEQERLARSMGAGHRILWGVAGSGKTIVLITRARILAEAIKEKKSKKKVLVTCFNLTLAAYLKHVLADVSDVVEVEHFHSIASKRWKMKVLPEDQYDAELEKALIAMEGKYKKKYSTILVDEAQDFHPIWIKALLALMEDPLEGDFIIAGDGNQGIFKTKGCSWKSIGIRAQGRTTRLKTNYRNSAEIVELAAPFSVGYEDSGDNGVDSILLDPKNAVRSTGIKPVFLQASNDQNMITPVIDIIKGLLKGTFNGVKLCAPLEPEEIGVLYPAKIDKTFSSVLYSMVGKISKLDKSVLWMDKREAKVKICDPGIKVLTIHSAKGLQFRAVIVFGADILPRTDIDATPADEKKLLYVALTRAEDFLVVCSAGRKSEFIDQITSMKAVIDPPK